MYMHIHSVAWQPKFQVSYLSMQETNGIDHTVVRVGRPTADNTVVFNHGKGAFIHPMLHSHGCITTMHKHNLVTATTLHHSSDTAGLPTWSAILSTSWSL